MLHGLHVASVMADDVKERREHLAGQIYRLHRHDQLNGSKRSQQGVIRDAISEWILCSGATGRDLAEACQPWLRCPVVGWQDAPAAGKQPSLYGGERSNRRKRRREPTPA